MAVCILGMHRSGTSMGTRLLGLCGLELRVQDGLLAADPADNPTGYWEHMGFMEVNQELLRILGGTWDRPPELRPGWQTAPALDPLRERARDLIHRFGECPGEWGWKDPRNCLTLAFWRDLIPGLRYLLFVRHPSEVALSLGRGGVNRNLPTDRTLSLWTQYHLAILNQVAPRDLLVSHYESYFYDPARELERVATALGLTSTRSEIRSAVASITPTLRRLRVLGVPAGSIEGEPWGLYQTLVKAAGPVHSTLRADRAFLRAELEASAQALHRELVRRSDRSLELEAELARSRVHASQTIQDP